MAKFNLGDKVRKNLWSGIWTIKDFNSATNTYTISQIIQYQTLEYPKGNVMVYSIADGSMKEIIDLNEMKLEFVEEVEENELKDLPDLKTLRIQQHLDIRDDELFVLRKIVALVGANGLPHNIDLKLFSTEEISSIYSIIGKQYWFQISDSEFVTANESHLIVKKDLRPITNVYINYR